MSADVPAELEDALRPLITAIQTVNEQIRCCDAQIETLATEIYPQTALPRQVTGVGALTALAFILTIADAARFAKSRDIGPYLRLVPRQDDSGDHRSQLRITKAGTHTCDDCWSGAHSTSWGRSDQTAISAETANG